MKEFATNQYEMVYGTNKGGDGWATLLPPTTKITSDADDLEDDYYASVGGNPFENRRAYRLFNKGWYSRGTVVGGEFDFESARQMYGLGKLVKKVTRTVKKIAKSPIGKAAIIGGTWIFRSNKKSFWSRSFRKFFCVKVQIKKKLVNNRLWWSFNSSTFRFMKPEEDDEEEEQYRGEKLDIAGY